MTGEASEKTNTSKGVTAAGRDWVSGFERTKFKWTNIPRTAGKDWLRGIQRIQYEYFKHSANGRKISGIEGHDLCQEGNMAISEEGKTHNQHGRSSSNPLTSQSSSHSTCICVCFSYSRWFQYCIIAVSKYKYWYYSCHLIARLSLTPVSPPMGTLMKAVLQLPAVVVVPVLAATEQARKAS